MGYHARLPPFFCKRVLSGQLPEASVPASCMLSTSPMSTPSSTKCYHSVQERPTTHMLTSKRYRASLRH